MDEVALDEVVQCPHCGYNGELAEFSEDLELDALSCPDCGEEIELDELWRW